MNKAAWDKVVNELGQETTNYLTQETLKDVSMENSQAPIQTGGSSFPNRLTVSNTTAGYWHKKASSSNSNSDPSQQGSINRLGASKSVLLQKPLFLPASDPFGNEGERAASRKN